MGGNLSLKAIEKQKINELRTQHPFYKGMKDSEIAHEMIKLGLKSTFEKSLWENPKPLKKGSKYKDSEQTSSLKLSVGSHSKSSFLTEPYFTSHDNSVPRCWA